MPKTTVLSMRYLSLLLLVLLAGSCEKNELNDILPTTRVDEIVNLDLPQYINLKTPSGWVYSPGGLKGIIIQNTGIGNPPFKAFERACPNNDCSAPMTFDGSLKMTCSCDSSQYSIIDGSPQTSGNPHHAREYRVIQVSSNTLNIVNF